MYLFMQRDKESSVYSAVSKYLLKNRSRDWQKVSNKAFRFHLMLGDRNKLPYDRLGHFPGVTQLVNYYRGSENICRKTKMVKTFKEYVTGMKKPMFSWLPESFIVYPQCDESDVAETREPVSMLIKSVKVQVPKDEREDLIKTHDTLTREGSDVCWIAKPSSASKGEGIQISRELKELFNYIDSQEKSFIIQRYISNPLLLTGGRKFDIRSWVLVDGEFSIFLYHEGVLRTSSEEYSVSDVENLVSHLTNHHLQKENSKHYGMFEEGNEMFFDDFSKFLLKCYGANLETILRQIRDIVKDSFHSIKDKIQYIGGFSYRNFQLFGFDFIVDENIKVWLIEINGAPACAEKLLEGMVESLVATVIDPCFPPSQSVQTKNLFEKIY